MLGVATFTFSGLPPILGGSFLFMRGVDPGRGLLHTLTRPEIRSGKGTLTINQDGTTIQLRDCTVGVPKLVHRAEGNRREGDRWEVPIFDRRDAWQYGRISGQYNVRLPDWSIKEGTEKEPQELAGMLFEAMGQTDYDLSGMPNQHRPQCLWQDARADLELGLLCDHIGCAPGIRLNGRGQIWQLGVGRELPPNGLEITPPLDFMHCRFPEKLRFAAGPTVFQDKFKLRGIGIDTDSYKLLPALSYMPSGGWSTQWYQSFAGVSPTYRHLAFRSVWRLYQAYEFARGGLQLPGVNETIDSIEQFEFLDYAPVVGKDPLNFNRVGTTTIDGVWWPQSDRGYNVSGMIYDAPYELLPELKAVYFQHPVVKLCGQPYGECTAGCPTEAELYLTCAFRVRKRDGSGYVQFTEDRSIDNHTDNGGVRELYHPYVYEVIRQLYSGLTSPGSIVRNTDAVRQEAAAYMDAIANEYRSGLARDMEWQSILEIEPDGAIAAVLWRTGEGRHSITRASRNSEFFVDPGLSYSQRRARQRALHAAMISGAV